MESSGPPPSYSGFRCWRTTTLPNTPASSCALKVPCRCTSMLVSVYPPVLLPVVNACAWAEKKLPLFPPAVCPMLLTSTAAAAGAAANGDSAASSSARTGRGRRRRARARPAGASGRQRASRESRPPRGATPGRWAAGPLGRWAAGPLGRWAAGHDYTPGGGPREPHVAVSSRFSGIPSGPRRRFRRRCLPHVPPSRRAGLRPARARSVRRSPGRIPRLPRTARADPRGGRGRPGSRTNRCLPQCHATARRSIRGAYEPRVICIRIPSE